MNPVTPAVWSSTKRKHLANAEPKKNKRNKTDNEDNITYLGNIVESHIRAAENKQEDNFQVYDMTTLLQKIPFINMLADVAADGVCENLPVVSRVYEEQYMRQCLNEKEQKCVMNKNCECMLIDRANPFVGVQFPLPGMSADSNNMCILCLRKTTQMLFYQAVHCGFKINGVIQKYGNICAEPGEYDKSVMLICPPHGPVSCLPLPVVSHQRNRYKVVKQNEILWILQQNVGYEDFV